MPTRCTALIHSPRCLPAPERRLWFTPQLEAIEGEGSAPLERSATERAQQLADVALAVYEAGGRAIHLPLDPGHPLVAVMRAALGVGARGDLKVSEQGRARGEARGRGRGEVKAGRGWVRGRHGRVAPCTDVKYPLLSTSRQLIG